MTKQSWTAGPWRISTTHQRVENATGRTLVAICPKDADNMPDGIPRTEAEANARLIALAPEMAEALRRLIAVTEQEDAHLSNFGEFEQARAILTKLEGGQ